MADITSNENLMVWLMHRLHDVAGEAAVLKGGMTLRLLDCPRYTNDLDYVFVGFKSKKDIIHIVEKILGELPGAKWNFTMHSTSMRVIVRYGAWQSQIESNVATSCKAIGLSTSSLARPNNQLPRVISVMSLDWALANKLSAWNERGLMRDLYDIYFLHSVLDIMPNKDVLLERLAKINYSGKGREKNLPKKMTPAEFIRKLFRAATAITSETVEVELRDYFTPVELAGLAQKMKIGVKSLVDKMS